MFFYITHLFIVRSNFPKLTTIWINSYDIYSSPYSYFTTVLSDRCYFKTQLYRYSFEIGKQKISIVIIRFIEYVILRAI